MELNGVEILLVEDNTDDVELIRRALKKHGLTDKLYAVRDGVEAIDFLFSTGDFSAQKIKDGLKLILLDLKLPRADGLVVLRKIKSDKRTKTIPVVVLTSSHQERDLVESYNLGANSYIVKPVEFNKFSQTVSDVVLYWLSLNKPPVKHVKTTINHNRD